jgi:hypothetical protein
MAQRRARPYRQPYNGPQPSSPAMGTIGAGRPLLDSYFNRLFEIGPIMIALTRWQRSFSPAVGHADYPSHYEASLPWIAL